MTAEEIADEERIEAGIMRDPGSTRIIVVETSWIEKSDVLRLIELLQAELKRMT